MPEETHTATYASYLKIDELLSLQQPRSAGPEHDETLFIVIHQVYELCSRSCCTSWIVSSSCSKPTTCIVRSTP
jgi:tryptophan 2,3-dioxygenase